MSIWYSWGFAEAEALRTISQSFQKLYPNVTFNLVYVPMNDLLNTYEEAAYAGQGPSLLMGPAEWGPELYEGQYIRDLSKFVPANYLPGINPAALGSGTYHEALISLPLSQHGVVMYRNTDVIPTAPQTFEELSALSQAATHAGFVGSYLERGAYISSADLLGLGGAIMSDALKPTFDDHFGVEWLNLLRAYDDAGAVTFNTNRDLDMFKRGRVGIIIDGTWNLTALVEAIGADKLAIDPWPSYGTGHLSGWVEADSVYLNTNVTGNDQFAALAFMGYLLDPNVQARLAEVGLIPSVTAATPRDRLIQQAMQAFSDGVTYPISVDPATLSLYWQELNHAILDVFVGNNNPGIVLRAASEEISQILLNSTPAP